MRMQNSQNFGQVFIIMDNLLETRRSGTAMLNTPAFEQQESFLGFQRFDDNQFNPLLGIVLLCLIACIVLLNESNFNSVICGFLYLLCRFCNFGNPLDKFLFVGRRYMQNQWMTHFFHGQLHFVTPLTLIPSGPSTLATHGRRPQWVPKDVNIENHHRKLLIANRSQAQQVLQILKHTKYACRYPKLDLLISGITRQQSIRHHAPHSIYSHQPLQVIEGFTQRIITLWRTFPPTVK